MKVISSHFHDQYGNPEGGISSGLGYTIAWQNGPCADDESRRNGAFLIEVLQACWRRLYHYQDSKFECEENERALVHLQSSIDELEDRRNRRKEAGTLGSHTGT